MSANNGATKETSLPALSCVEVSVEYERQFETGNAVVVVLMENATKTLSICERCSSCITNSFLSPTISPNVPPPPRRVPSRRRHETKY